MNEADICKDAVEELTRRIINGAYITVAGVAIALLAYAAYLYLSWKLRWRNT